MMRSSMQPEEAVAWTHGTLPPTGWPGAGGAPSWGEGRTMRYAFGEYSLDTQRQELRRAGEPIKLRRKVFQVLAYLLANGEQVVSKQELLDHVWPEQFV